MQEHMEALWGLACLIVSKIGLCWERVSSSLQNTSFIQNQCFLLCQAAEWPYRREERKWKEKIGGQMIRRKKKTSKIRVWRIIWKRKGSGGFIANVQVLRDGEWITEMSPVNHARPLPLIQMTPPPIHPSIPGERVIREEGEGSGSLLSGRDASRARGTRPLGGMITRAICHCKCRRRVPGPHPQVSWHTDTWHHVHTPADYAWHERAEPLVVVLR